MRKRISCRVVRSIPLSKSSDALRDASRSSDKRHETGDVVAETPTAKTYVWEDSHPRLRGDEFTPARDPALREPKAGAKDCPATYIDRLGIARVPTGDGLTAQILDFYV